MPYYNNRSCYFKENKINFVDYKNVPLLKKFTTKYFKITPKYYTGTSLKAQKMLARAIKNARFMGLIPYTK